MFRHLGRVALLAVSTLFSAVLVAPPASADPPIDTYGEPYPLCGAAGETDGQYCVQSFLRNGVKVTPPPASAQQGTYDDPYVTSAGDAGVMFRRGSHDGGQRRQELGARGGPGGDLERHCQHRVDRAAPAQRAGARPAVRARWQ